MSYIVAFIGLPSSGKSSIINSLLNKRVLQSGVCRTTIEQKELDEFIIDDDNNKFKVIDLPGICDSEETDTKFTDMTLAYISNANLIFWVSDVSKAFITTHEVNEYNKVKIYLNKLTYETGTIYDISIILSKCNMNDSDFKDKDKTKTNTLYNNDGELVDEDEDTNMFDMVKKVREKFPNENIMLFNAFGRTIHNKNASQNFKNFIIKMGGYPTEHNTRFSISKFYKNHDEKQEKQFCEHFERNFNNYLSGINTIEIIMKCYDKLDENNKKKYLLLNCKIENNTYKYRFINQIVEKYNEIYSLYCDQINIFLISYEIHILKNNHSNIIEIYDKISKKYSELSEKEQLHLFDKIIINNEFSLNDINLVNIYWRIYYYYLNNSEIENDDKFMKLIEYEFDIIKKQTIILENKIINIQTQQQQQKQNIKQCINNNNNYNSYNYANNNTIFHLILIIIDTQINKLNNCQTSDKKKVLSNTLKYIHEEKINFVESLFVKINETIYDLDKICDLINFKFRKLNFEYKEKIIDDIIFTNTYNICDEIRIKFIKDNFEATGGFEKYKFMKKFNDFVSNISEPDFFKKMSFVIIEYCSDIIEKYNFGIDYHHIYKKYLYKFCKQCITSNNLTNHKQTINQINNQHTYIYDKIGTTETKCKIHNIELEYSDIFIKEKKSIEEIKIIIKDYFETLDSLINDEKYLILNKLQILDKMYDNESYSMEHFDFGKKHNIMIGNILRKIKLSSEYKKKYEYMMNKIFSNKITIDNIDLTTNHYEPLDKSELLFVLDNCEDKTIQKDFDFIE
jgi:hypothetical protein